MADVRVTIPARTLANPAGQASLVCGSLSIVLPWWPTEIGWSQLAYSWSEQARPGRAPLLLQEAQTLPEITLGFILASKPATYLSQSAGIQGELDTLRAISTSDTPAQLMLAARDTGRWRVIDLSYTEIDHAAEGSPIRAEVSVTLKRAKDAAAPIGPIKPKGKGKGR